MSNYSVSVQDQRKAEKIRNQYIPMEENQVAKLKKLDQKVKRPGQIVSCLVGAIGALVMGAGMALVMVWSNMTLGLVLGIPGLVVALLAYPIYMGITKSRKKKYANEILNISNTLAK